MERGPGLGRVLVGGLILCIAPLGAQPAVDQRAIGEAAPTLQAGPVVETETAGLDNAWVDEAGNDRLGPTGHKLTLADIMDGNFTAFPIPSIPINDDGTQGDVWTAPEMVQLRNIIAQIRDPGGVQAQIDAFITQNNQGLSPGDPGYIEPPNRGEWKGPRLPYDLHPQEYFELLRFAPKTKDGSVPIEPPPNWTKIADLEKYDELYPTKEDKAKAAVTVTIQTTTVRREIRPIYEERIVYWPG